jgi:hypothetical protein
MYAMATMTELTLAFGRTKAAIKMAAVKHCLSKSPALVAEKCRFQKGHATWNAGKPWSPSGSRATWFKRGQRGARQRPIGSERNTRDGIEVKVAEPGTWVAKARVIWERRNGPIPNGSIIRLLDGSKDNFSAGNLLCITRAKNMRLNYRPRRPKQRSQWLMPLQQRAERASI